MQDEVALVFALATSSETPGCDPVCGAGVQAVGEGFVEQRVRDVRPALQEEFVAQQGDGDIRMRRGNLGRVGEEGFIWVGWGAGRGSGCGFGDAACEGDGGVGWESLRLRGRHCVLAVVEAWISFK